MLYHAFVKRQDRINGFVTEIWSWYSRHKRELPWRDLKDKDDTQRAYKILVSEVMLQQTQVPRVIVIYKRFLEQFPTIADLARAGNKEVIIAWRGMGYNSRALRLRDAAKIIVDQHAGIFPHDFNQLVAIKGIGPYTASAIRSFAFNIATPGIDTNIRRVLHRTFFGPENADGSFSVSDKKLLVLCTDVLNEWMKQGHNARDFFAALMDFGSLVQTKSNPKWDVCPLTEKGLMKTTRKSYKSQATSRGIARYAPTKIKKEPGRMEGARYVPNRIFRGRIVDALREDVKGLTLEKLGSHICLDWQPSLKPWLKAILSKLERDELLARSGSRFVLKD